MIEGIRIYATGVTEDGDMLDNQHVTLAVISNEAGRLDLEVTLEDGSTWAVDMNSFDRALDYVKAEERATREAEDAA